MSMVRFGDVAERVNTKEDRFNTDLVYYVGGDHIETNELKVSGRGIIKEADLGPMFYFGFKPGDILFVTRNPHLRKSAKVDFAGICSEKTLVIATKDENVLLQDYLAGVMQSDDFWDFMEENKSGSVNYFINWSTLADYEFDLPPIEKQRELAELLWAANDLKESYKKLIVATDEMLKAKFREMFGDDIRFPRCNISDVCDLINGRAFKPSDWSLEGVPIVRIQNLNDISASFQYFKGEIEERYLLHDGDLLFSWSGTPGTSFGAFMWNRGNAVLNQHIFNVIPVKSSRAYLKVALEYVMPEIVSKAHGGAGMKHITKAELGMIRVPVPNEEDQTLCVEIARKADETKAALKKSIADVESVIKGLING